jgi:Ca-activated chloride channel family protein
VSSATQENNQAIRYLWARERIKLHDDYRRYYGANRQKHIKKITALGLKYNLLTQYTSFIAVSPEVRNKEGKIVTVKQPLPLPKGVSKHAIGNNRSVNYSTRGAGASYQKVKRYRPRKRYMKKNYSRVPTPSVRTTSVTAVDDKALEVEEVVELRPGLKGGKKDHKPKLPTLNRVYHQVKTGETLAAIAKKYKYSVAELMLWNNLKAGEPLKVGQKLTLYTSKKSYIVKKGDSLKKVARRFGVKTRQIKTWNKLKSKKLTAGQTLVIYGR